MLNLFARAAYHPLTILISTAVLIRTVIIDDEAPARLRIRKLLDEFPDFEIVNEAASVSDAVSACATESVDLLFLDVQLPDGTGFDVLDRLEGSDHPAVVFVTAFDQFTIQAFDLHAVDYLLKPFSKERFYDAANRIRHRLNGAKNRGIDREVLELLSRAKSTPKFLDRLAVAHQGRLLVLLTEDIDWVLAFGNYVKLHSKGKTHLMRGTINHLAERLDPERFLRIHRSVIVRIDCVKEFQPHFGGQYVVLLKDGTNFVLSRNYRKEVFGRFGM